MSFYFQKQLKLGQLGEDIFSGLNPGLKRTDGRQADFLYPDGSGLELKTDFYSVDATPNFFMERWYDVEKKKDGGPWSSLRKGVGKFVYFYVKDGMSYWFETASLVKALDEFIRVTKTRPTRVVNKGWITEGYKVPRKVLEPIYEEVQYDPKIYIGRIEGHSFSNRVSNQGNLRK